MKFGPLALELAQGAILAHALRLPSGRRLRKGIRLGPDEIEAIRQAGIGEVIAAWLEPDDTGEDEAASRIAAALARPGIRVDAAATGRANLHAEADGLFFADRAIVDAINAIEPGITLATLDNLSEVNSGRLVATVKIIPYAVPTRAVDRAVAMAAAGMALGIHPYLPKRIGVVATRLPSLKSSVMDKTIRVLEGRLAASGSTISGEIRTAHEAAAVAGAIGEMLARSDIVLVFGASAISDIDDVIPAAIRDAGGSIVHFGMPVDPGNLMLLGEVGGKPVIGAPGCARSPAENGFDWILQRLIAGRQVTAAEITGMGVGGLLMEIGTRPQPREAVAPPAARVAAVILAAGRSTRMGVNKLAATLGGKPVVAHVVDAALASSAAATIVVTGHESARAEASLAGRKVSFANNPDYAAGLATSLAAGIRAVPADCGAALVLLGDMPRVTAAMIDRMIAVAPPGEAIVVATHSGIRGNPVLWPRGYFPELLALSGDKGARELIAEHGDKVVAVELGEAAGFDLDTPDALAAAGGVAG